MLLTLFSRISVRFPTSTQYCRHDRQLQESAEYTLRTINAQNLYLAFFIDLTEASDSVNLDLHWDVLDKAGCPPKSANILNEFRTDIAARVTLGGIQSDPFTVCLVVKQGCNLAPIFFNICLAAVTLLSPNQTLPNPFKRIKSTNRGGTEIRYDLRIELQTAHLHQSFAVPSCEPDRTGESKSRVALWDAWPLLRMNCEAIPRRPHHATHRCKYTTIDRAHVFTPVFTVHRSGPGREVG